MTLRAQILEAIGPHGVEPERLRYTMREHPLEQVDAVLAGLIRNGEVLRHGPRLTRAVVYTTHGRCSVCGQPQAEDWLLETGICLTCASEQTIAAEEAARAVSSAGRTCSCCKAVRDVSQFRKGAICNPCLLRKRRDYEAQRSRRRALAGQHHDPDGEPTWKTTFRRMTTTDSALPGGSYSASSRRCSSGR